MIIELRDASNQEEYIICPPMTGSLADVRNRMVELAKVKPESYAYRLVCDIYEAIFVQSLDLKADYRNYFAVEYPTFVEYLCRRYQFTTPVVSACAGAVDDSLGIYYFRSGYAFLRDEYGLEFLGRLTGTPIKRPEA